MSSCEILIRIGLNFPKYGKLAIFPFFSQRKNSPYFSKNFSAFPTPARFLLSCCPNFLYCFVSDKRREKNCKTRESVTMSRKIS